VRTPHDILREVLMRRTACFQHLTRVEKEGGDCLVAKTIYFNMTESLRQGNIANGAQNPLKLIKFAILSCSSFLSLRIRLSEQ